MVSSTPWPHFTPGKDPVPILQETGWAPGPVWTGGKSRPHRDSIPDRAARSQSLYRLSYPAHVYFLVCFKYQPEDDRWSVEICSWLNYYFYRVFFKVVSLPLFVLQHNRLHKVKSCVCNMSLPTCQTTRSYIPDTVILVDTAPGLLK